MNSLSSFVSSATPHPRPPIPNRRGLVSALSRSEVRRIVAEMLD